MLGEHIVVLCEFIFFFQAEDGIRDVAVTGVQTCALPISPAAPLVPYSLGPCCTTGGRPPKLSNGGGDVVDHSRLVASQGLSGALGPRNRVRMRLNRKINCAAPVHRAATVMNRCSGISGLR